MSASAWAALSPSEQEAFVEAHRTPDALAHLITNGKQLRPPHLRHLGSLLASEIAKGGARIAVTMPPRHGKSEECSWWLPVWFLALAPEQRIILSCYGADFAAEWGRRVRNTIESDFPSGYLDWTIADDSAAANRWHTSKGGGMYSVGYGGPMTGRGANLLIIDDPIKNEKDALSEVCRENNWRWWQQTALTRLEPGGSVVIIHTRWHEDDLLGRILAREKDAWTVVNFPAIAESSDMLGRQAGGALWPERYDERALEIIRKGRNGFGGVGEYAWSALYQQRPTPAGGGMFKRGDFEIVDGPPTGGVLLRVRAWDLAASTSELAKQTAGVLLSITNEGLGYIEHVVSGQWEPGERDRIVVQTAKADGRDTKVLIEKEPGSGGIAQISTLQRALFGYAVEAVDATGRKEVRAGPAASSVAQRRIRLVRGDWNAPFLDEAQAFPNGVFLDRIDAFAHAFNHIAEWLEAQHIDFGAPPKGEGWEAQVPEYDPPEDPLAQYRPRSL